MILLVVIFEFMIWFTCNFCGCCCQGWIILFWFVDLVCFVIVLLESECSDCLGDVVCFFEWFDDLEIKIVL